MKTWLALAVALVVASPAAARYKFTTVDAPGQVLGTVVSSINDYGLATGYYVSPDGFGGPGTYTGFTVNVDGTGFTSFTRSGYAQTGAAGINNYGDITGVSVTALGQGTGFVRSGFDGSYTDIDAASLGAFYSEAIGINDFGAVTGYYVTDPAATVATLTQYAHGFITYDGVYTAVDVDAADGYGTQVTSINDFGEFTGTYYDNSANHFAQSFVGQYDPTDATYQILLFGADPFGAPSSSIGNITNNLYTTYNSLYPSALSPTGFASAAYVLDLLGGGFEPLEVPGAYFTTVFGINQATDVTGFYVDPTGIHGFVGSYVPEPANWMLMIAGFGLVGSILRRREVTLARG